MQVAYEVLRTTTDITEHADRPKCIGCGFTDGCVDDPIGGAVYTVWTDSPYGWLCRSCTNQALWKAYGRRAGVLTNPSREVIVAEAA